MKLPIFTFLFLTSYVISFSTIAAEFVGSQQCISCHKEQTNTWQGSHHDMAMKHADENSVLGDFNNHSLTESGNTSSFYRKGNEYWVNISGPDGKHHDYQITFTFGYEPLQQYMVEFDDGRVQLIPFAWDSRTKEQGGQRWFNLYPEFTDSREEFFWTNTGQNWNYMCADCHSTNVQKNYDIKTNTYNTTYSEINVGCEACHGPASSHLTWANQKNKTEANKGFNRILTKPVTNWLATKGKTTLQPEKINHSQQTLVCAQCHSRHVQISNKDHVNSNNFGERYTLSLINNGLYYPDGQIYDEDYVYGSFLQSKMAEKGVTCTNCHDPHSAKLRIPVESVCLQCHQSDVYAVKTHHQHSEASSGAQCVNCHMPETTYMKIDNRRDHGWHIPRPDLAKQLGTPDTCLSCHKDKNSQWSDQHLKTWFPNSTIRATNHFAPVFSAADLGYPEAANALSHVAQNKQNAEIIRASALERMANFPNTNTLIAIARGAKEPDENIRLGAIRGARSIAINERWRILAPLLSDKVLAVRLEAAFALVPDWQSLEPQQKDKLTPAINEYLTAQNFNADRGFSHTNKGVVYSYQLRYADAEKAFNTSITLEPNFVTAYTNLAELYRRQNNHNAVINTLNLGLKNTINNAPVAYQLGLAYIRAKQSSLANKYFKMAVDKEPRNAQYQYVYALSIENKAPTVAQQAMRKAFKSSGNPQHLFALCEMQIRYKAFGAKQCINELSKMAPENIITELKLKLKNNK